MRYRKRLKPAASIAGLVLIAPAVDFSEELMWKRFPPEVQREIEQTGGWARPSAYSEEPYLITHGLIEDGRRHLLLGGMIETRCPVRILQGVAGCRCALAARNRADRAVCARRCRSYAGERWRPPPFRPEDIERLIAAVAEF